MQFLRSVKGAPLLQLIEHRPRFLKVLRAREPLNLEQLHAQIEQAIDRRRD
jgi:hypothetical protein